MAGRKDEADGRRAGREARRAREAGEARTAGQAGETTEARNADRADHAGDARRSGGSRKADKARDGRGGGGAPGGPLSRKVTRAGLFEGMMFAGLGALLLRTGYWQTVRSGELASLAKEERTANQTLPYRRGAIYDRNGVVLAQSVARTSVQCDPTLVRPEQVGEIAEAIYRRFGGSYEEYVSDLTATNSRGVTILSAADVDAAADLQSLGYQGLYYRSVYQRVYPLKEVGCSVIGCLRSDGVPASGLELQYDSVLTGEDGASVRELANTGGLIVGGQSEYEAPTDGADVRISLDVDIQRVAQETLAQVVSEWKSGDACAVVIQPETGEILACASTPTFDPNHLDNVDALSLKPITSSYEPGSVFKPLSFSMAIDLGIATPTTSYWAPAKVKVGDDWVSDADGRQYEMDMTITNALERSSNVGTVLCLEQVGPEKFSEYLERYQIGHATGVDYPYEDIPHVRTYEEFDGAWEAMTFGQSIAVSPLELCRAIAAIANEGVLTTPHFLLSAGGEDVDYGEGSRVISTSTADDVAWMMNSVVVNGYAYTGKIPGYNLSAKTGTAERYDSSTGTYSKDHYVVSFVGFGPTENPKACCYVLIDDVDMEHEELTCGAQWAAIMNEALRKLGVEPTPGVGE